MGLHSFKSRIAAGFVVCCFLCLPQIAQSQEISFVLDPEKTTVEFTLPATLHTVHGTFKVKSGSVHFDRVSGAGSSSFVVDATSGNTGNDGRDHKMHEEILESRKYPEVEFVPQKLVGTLAQGDSTVQVQGLFRLHGTEHEATLSIPLHISGNEVTAKFQFTVPYIAWGLKNPSTFVLRVAKEVELEVTAGGKLITAQAP